MRVYLPPFQTSFSFRLLFLHCYLQFPTVAPSFPMLQYNEGLSWSQSRLRKPGPVVNWTWCSAQCRWKRMCSVDSFHLSPEMTGQ